MELMEQHFADLSPLLRPSSVAVVGASADPEKPGGRCLRYMRRYGYGGRVYPVNPRYSQIAGEICYPDFQTLPEAVDLAVVFLPSADVPKTLAAAGQAGIRAAIVFASGFEETGSSGLELSEAAMEVARRSGMLVLGPNCLGVFSLSSGLAATFSTLLERQGELRDSSVALVSQSGAMGAAIFSQGQNDAFPIGTFVSTGNELMVGIEDVIADLSRDPEVKTLLVYLEGVKHGRRFLAALALARRAGQRVAVLRAGRTSAGQLAAASHTAALATDTLVASAALRRATAADVETPVQLIDVGVALATCPLPRGRRVGIVSTSGGAGVLMTDRTHELGLEVAPLSEDTMASLTSLLPSFSAVGNPIDCGGVAGSAETLLRCLNAVCDDPNVDVVTFFIGVSPALLDTLEKEIPRLTAAVPKPVLVAWLGAPTETIRRLREAGIAAYPDPAAAVDTAAALIDISADQAEGRRLSSPARAAQLQDRLAQQDGALDEYQTRGLLDGYEVPFVVSHLVTSPEEATERAMQLGTSVAVKATGLLHKTDSGGVALNVDPGLAGSAFEQVIDAAGVSSALVQPMAADGIELIVGLKNDPSFGHVVAVGMGGINAEVLQDVAVGLAPLPRSEAVEMVNSLRTTALLNGFRGRPAYDVSALVDVLVELGEFATDAGDRLLELEINPLTVYPSTGGCLALDAAALLGTRQQTTDIASSGND
jgi:acetate---CoA ligase (ADP-forming)